MNKEQQVLDLLKKDPFLPQQVIADRLGLSRSRVARYIMDLTRKGYIKGKGYIFSEQHRIVTIGSANIDISGKALAPLNQQDSNPGIIESCAGGVGRNIAQNIAMLGKESHFISVVGDDIYGDFLLDKTKEFGVNVDNCYKIPNEKTSTYLSLLDEKGEMLVAINDIAIIEKLTPSLLARRIELIQHAGLLMLDCNLTEKALAWLFMNVKKVPIFIDAVSTFKATKIKPWLSYIHTLKPNRLEAECISGMSINSAQDIEKVATWFHHQGTKRIVLSLGKDGVYYSEDGIESGWASPLKVNVVNVTGAGDAMMAGLACCYVDSMPLSESVRYAQACSVLALSSEFTNNPNLSNESVHKLLGVQ